MNEQLKKLQEEEREIAEAAEPAAETATLENCLQETLTLTGKTWSSDQNTFAAQVNSQVKLEVYKDNRWIELTAEQGQPACKIATSVNIYMKDYDWYPEEYRWPWEKQNIGVDFKNWVADPTVKWYTTRKSIEETNAGE